MEMSGSNYFFGSDFRFGAGKVVSKEVTVQETAYRKIKEEQHSGRG